VVGCVDAEQGEAAGQHRPGSFGEREPGTVGGRGFLVAAREHGGQDGEAGIGDGDEVPGQAVGRAVRCRTRENAGVVGKDGGELGDRVLSYVVLSYFLYVVLSYVAGLGGEAQVGGVTAEGPGAGVGVTDAEERVALALEQVIGGDTGPVVDGGVQERPAGGVGAEEGGVVGGRDGPEVRGFAMVDFDAAALGADDAHEGVGDDFGPDVVRDAQFDDLSGEGVAVAVCRTLAEDLADEGGAPGCRRLLQADVDEPRSGDDDVGDTVRPGEVLPQDLGDAQGWLPGRPSELEGDVGGVVTTATRAGRHDNGTLRHGHTQLPLVNSTTHRAQHGTGELDGRHGPSVWEEGGG